MIRGYLKNFVFITLPVLLLLFVLFEFVILRLFIPSCQLPFLIYDERESLLKFNPAEKKEGVYTLGPFARERASWSINQNGWNSALDYPEQKTAGVKRICIIGDSYVEALQVDVANHVSRKLQEILGNSYEVFSFGISGAPFSQYLHLSRYVSRHYHPDLIIFNLVHNDFDESLKQFKDTPSFLQLEINNGEIHEVAPSKPHLHRYLKKSAIVRYLIANLGVMSFMQQRKAGKEKEFNANIDVEALNQRKAQVKAATNYLVEKIKEENPNAGILFVMDAPRQDIYTQRLQNSSVLWLNQMMSEICVQAKVDFLDLTNVFSANFEQHQKKFNSELDYHWDAYGHQVVAHALAEKISGNYFNAN